MTTGQPHAVPAASAMTAVERLLDVRPLEGANVKGPLTAKAHARTRARRGKWGQWESGEGGG